MTTFNICHRCTVCFTMNDTKVFPYLSDQGTPSNQKHGAKVYWCLGIWYLEAENWRHFCFLIFNTPILLVLKKREKSRKTKKKLTFVYHIFALISLACISQRAVKAWIIENYLNKINHDKVKENVMYIIDFLYLFYTKKCFGNFLFCFVSSFGFIWGEWDNVWLSWYLPKT